MTSYCSYTPIGKEQSTQNKTKMCAIIVFYVYFVLYTELLFGDVGLNGSLNHLDNFKFRKIIENWSSASQVSGGCGIYKVGVIEDNFYNSISKHVTAFRNVGDYSLIIFSWNGLDTLNYGIGLLASPRSTTFCLVQVWAGVFNLYDI